MAKAGGDAKPPIIIKRIKKVAGGHHGGAWKIAYADFVTAMMAFFLLMWLLGSTTKGDLQGIADYFQSPLKVALAGGSGSGDSSSVVNGGGQDLSRTHGQVARTDRPDRKRTINLQAAQEEAKKREMMKLKELKLRMEGVIQSSRRLSQFSNQIRLDITSEGLRIQIVDEQNRPMFDMGRARLKEYTVGVLHEIAVVLNEVDNKVSLTGHTDAAPYSGGERGYSNWELSADRANASRRELVAGGLAENKIIRVVGLSDSVPLKADDPRDPSNRRISIIVMTTEASDHVRQTRTPVEIKDGEEAADVIKEAVGAGTPARESAVPAKE